MIGYIKLALMVITMTMGFFLIYGVVWTLIAHELTEETVILLFALAIVSEVAYLLWVTEWR